MLSWQHALTNQLRMRTAPPLTSQVNIVSYLIRGVVNVWGAGLKFLRANVLAPPFLKSWERHWIEDKRLANNI